MPSWGRSFGARNGKRRGLREKHSLHLEDDMRFELVDSNEDEGHGIGLNRSFDSDDIDLTEEVLATQQEAHSTYYDRYASHLSESTSSDLSSSSGGVRQLAYRDKEDQLVQIALDRIQRAQALGERNVRLTKPELDALERKRRKNHAIGRNTAYSERSFSPSSVNQRNSATVGSRSSKRRTMPNKSGFSYSGSSTQGKPVSQARPASPRHENQEDKTAENLRSPQLEPYDLSTQPRMRSINSHSSLYQNPPPTTTRSRDRQKRYFSVPKGFGSSPAAEGPPLPRRLPDDPQWIPRARSASSNQPFRTGDAPQSIYTPSPLNAAFSRPQARRSVFENYRNQPDNWGRDTQSPPSGTTPPQPTFSQFEGSDAPISILSYANDSEDSGYNGYSAEFDYVPQHELGNSRAQFDGYFRR